MTFLLAAVVSTFLTTPGMYLAARSRLAGSIAEVIGAGFFLGVGISVLTYLGCGWHVSATVTDWILLAWSVVSFFLLVSELKTQRLPFWLPTANKAQRIAERALMAFSLVFMLVLTFGDMATCIDDDLFMHFPNIKRIAMGDIPPHVPYFPDTFLRGHTGRDIVVATIARIFSLRPEIAVIYVTLAVCPFYVLIFYLFSYRLNSGHFLRTAFCLFGLLFIVSCSIGGCEIRTGCITYVLNNNIFAYSYAIFFSWLILQILNAFKVEEQSSLWSRIRRNWLPLAILVVSYAALFFVYIPNFMMLSVYLAVLPLLLYVVSSENRLRRFCESLVVLVIAVSGVLALHLIVSPFLSERVLVSLNLVPVTEPMGFVQQAHLTFPKPLPWSITEPAGFDVPFFTWQSLSSQGASLYLGLLGLFVGLVCRVPAITATAAFGWITYLWLLLVDMGEYRAEPLRLLLVAHIALGASTAMMVALALEWFLKRIESSHNKKHWQKWKYAGVAVAVALCASMSVGNAKKFITGNYWNLAENVAHMKRIHEYDSENWHDGLNMARIDHDAFEWLEKNVHDPMQRLMLKVSPDRRFILYGIGNNRIAPMINAATITGMGIAGVTQEHAPPHMSVAIFPYDYRSSLFWHIPTAALLKQLSPDWLVVDPTLLPDRLLKQVLSIRGVSVVKTFDGPLGQRRLILRFNTAARDNRSQKRIDAITPATFDVTTERFGLIRLPVEVECPPESASAIGNVALLVLDKEGKEVNTMDKPLLPVLSSSKSNLSPGRFDSGKINSKIKALEICFSMIQSGHWQVFFLDSYSRRKLHEKPIQVYVREDEKKNEPPRPDTDLSEYCPKFADDSQILFPACAQWKLEECKFQSEKNGISEFTTDGNLPGLWHRKLVSIDPQVTPYFCVELGVNSSIYENRNFRIIYGVDNSKTGKWVFVPLLPDGNVHRYAFDLRTLGISKSSRITNFALLPLDIRPDRREEAFALGRIGIVKAQSE